jgi:hypothetical protein
LLFLQVLIKLKSVIFDHLSKYIKVYRTIKFLYDIND